MIDISSEDMYQDIILEYYKNPVNFGHLSAPTVKAEDSNPLCGDQIEMELLIENNVIQDVKFYGKGCAISQASASMLTEKLKGMSVEDAAKLDRKDILEMLGIELSPVRSKCALLSLKVMKLCVYNNMDKKFSESIE